MLELGDGRIGQRGGRLRRRLRRRLKPEPNGSGTRSRHGSRSMLERLSWTGGSGWRRWRRGPGRSWPGRLLDGPLRRLSTESVPSGPGRELPSTQGAVVSCVVSPSWKGPATGTRLVVHLRWCEGVVGVPSRSTRTRGKRTGRFGPDRGLPTGLATPRTTRRISKISCPPPFADFVTDPRSPQGKLSHPLFPS